MTTLDNNQANRNEQQKKGDICHYGEIWHKTRNTGNGPDLLIRMRGLQMSGEVGLDLNIMSQKEVRKNIAPQNKKMSQ